MVALVWGSIFFMTKDFITRVPQLDYLSIRYLIAGAVGAIAFAPRLRRTGAATWRVGLTLGLVYAIAQLARPAGCRRPPPPAS